MNKLRFKIHSVRFNRIACVTAGWAMAVALVVAVTAGCDSMRNMRLGSVPPAWQTNEADTKTAPSEQNAAAVEPSRRTGLSQAEQEVWDSPAFRQQFTETFIPDSELEPRVTLEERADMEKILSLISTNKTDEAIRLLSKHRGKSTSAVFDFTLANIYFQQEQLNEQQRSEKLKQLADESGGPPDAEKVKALEKEQERQRQEQLNKAAGAYGIAVEKHAKFRRAWRNMGLVYFRLRQYDKAVPMLTKVIQLGGGDASTYGLLGFSYLSSENSLAAESAYRAAILLDPATLEWKMGLARCLFKQERFAEAVSLCSQLIADQADRPELWMLQANAYIGLGQPLKAAENYEFVNRLGHSTADSLNTLGDIYTNEGIFDLAVGYYVQAMQKNPAVKPARAIVAAKVMTARGAIKESRELIDGIEAGIGEKLEIADRKELLRLRARMAVAEGASGEEVGILEEIVKLDPLDGETLILLGQHSARAGIEATRVSRAAAETSKAAADAVKTAKPEDVAAATEAAKAAEDAARKAEADKATKLDRAIFYFERAESLKDCAADAKVRHAQLLVSQGDYAKALPLLRQAHELKPRDNVREYIEQIERASKARS